VEHATRRRRQRARHLAADSSSRAPPPDARHRVEQGDRVGMRWMREQRRAWCRLDDAAQVKHRHAVGQMVHHRHVVTDEQIGELSAVLQLLHQVEDLALDRDVERRQRFVCHDQHGVGRQRAGNGDALTLTAGEFVRIAVQCIRRQANLAH
jgi:hypothetical protein